MKKITLLFTLLFTSSLMFGQVLSEDFEAGLTLPAGWTNNDLIVPSNGEIWTFETGGAAALLAAGNTNVYTSGGAVGNYASFDSDAYGNNGTAENAALESPVFSAAALTQVTLDFNHYFAGDFGGSGFVEVFDGNSWITVQTFSGNNYQGGLISIDVTAELAGVTNAQIRFRWTGNWSVAWYVDNISVFECTDSTPNAVITLGPTDGAIAAPIGAGGAVSFTWADGAGDPGSSFTLNLDTVNPPVANSFTNFNSGGTVSGLLVSTTYFWSVDAVNCAGTAAGTVWSFTTDTVLSIGDNEIEQPFKVYPNPTSGVLNIKTSLEIDNISIFNLLGQRVANFSKNSISNNSINISELSQGLYMVTISAGERIQTFRIIKE